MTSKSRTISRRDFAQFSGLAGIGMMFPSLFAERAEGQNQLPRRAIFIMSHNGVMPSGWGMQGSGSQFTLGPSYLPLQPYKSMLNVIEGMNFVSAGSISGHVSGGPSFLTNTRLDPFDQNNGDARATGISLDEYMRRELAKTLPGGSEMKGLLLPLTMGNQWGGGEFITYESAKNPIQSIDNPERAFQAAFGSYVAPTAGNNANAAEMQAALLKLRREKRSVLDFVMSDFQTMRKNLSKSERDKMEDHFQAVRELEMSLAADTPAPTEQAQCSADASQYTSLPEGKEQLFKKFSNIVVEAMACGQTRVATMRLTGGGPGIDNGKHHSMSHGDEVDSENKHNAVTRWQAEQVAYLLGKLSEKKEGGVSMLENTVVIWTNEIGIGPAGEHAAAKLPMIVAGRGGGYFKSGQLIKTGGRSHSQLLVSVAKAMGVGNNLTGWGDMKGCEPGELSEIKA